MLPGPDGKTLLCQASPLQSRAAMQEVSSRRIQSTSINAPPLPGERNTPSKTPPWSKSLTVRRC